MTRVEVPDYRIGYMLKQEFEKVQSVFLGDSNNAVYVTVRHTMEEDEISSLTTEIFKGIN